MHSNLQVKLHKDSYQSFAGITASLKTVHKNAIPYVRSWKPRGHSLMVTGTAGLTHSHLFVITDRVFAYYFLINTDTKSVFYVRTT